VLNKQDVPENLVASSEVLYGLSGVWNNPVKTVEANSYNELT
jgi:hypothetical protein